MIHDLPRDPVARHLALNERVIWQQAAPPLPLAVSKAPGLIFALAWAGFAWGWTTLVVGSLLPAVLLTPPSGVLTIFPFMFFGMGALFSSFGAYIVWRTIRDIMASWSTYYVLTNTRLMIVSGARATDFDGQAFEETQIDGDRNSGSISFAWGRMGRGSGFRGHMVGVREPARFAALVRTTLKC